MYYLTIGSCLKNEESYMEDFIKYHRAVGVEHFVFFDREYSTLSKLLGKEPDVEIIHFPENPNNIHMEAWGQQIKYNTGKTKWLALIDADQCLVPVQSDDVKETLKDYEDYASLQCNWMAFGSSYHEIRKPGSVYERFVLAGERDCKYNMHTQFICQPDKVLPIRTQEPHYPLVKPGEVLVNTNKEIISDTKVVELNPNTPLSFNTPPLHDVLYVNHYTNKSKEEWMIKNSKGRADIHGAMMPFDQFDEYESICNKVSETRAYEIWSNIK